MQNNLFQGAVRSLSWELPQGDILFSEISFTLGSQRYALVGPNGVGKSTLAKIMSGQLGPVRSGELRFSHSVTYLAQEQERLPVTVGEFLEGLWENPQVEPALWQNLLAEIPLEKSLTQLSGGEWMRVRILQSLAANTGLLILDEPTNNLDRKARELIYRFIENYHDALLVISHDRELLKRVDHIFELSNQGMSSYGGDYDFYQEAKEHEREVLNDKIDRARREKKKREVEFREKLDSQEKRMRRGEAIAARGGLPRILIGGLKRQAQVTQGKVQVAEEGRVQEAKEALLDLRNQQKVENHLGLELESTYLPEGKLVFEVEDFNFSYADSWLWPEDISFVMQGPRRWALGGVNGAGKTTLLKLLLSAGETPVGRKRGHIKKGQLLTAVIDQEYSLLNHELSVLENLRLHAGLDEKDLRNKLAHFQFYGEKVHQVVASLSGGEKLKACLAQALLTKSPPQLLVLDEPTNNLDLGSLEVLEKALLDFQGALLVISHDHNFLKNIEIESLIELE